MNVPPTWNKLDRELLEVWREHGIPVDHSSVEYALELMLKLLDRADTFEELWLKSLGAT